MNKDFHYYLTYFLLRSAGYSDDESYIVAYSNQYTDDNDVRYKISLKNSSFCQNTLTYTKRIYEISSEVHVIMPLHFLPGDIGDSPSERRDGKVSPINVTPDSKAARFLLRKAFASGDLFKSGIMLHSYQDTWAHQNFTGIWDDWNNVKDNPFIPNIGHAELGKTPDIFNMT